MGKKMNPGYYRQSLVAAIHDARQRPCASLPSGTRATAQRYYERLDGLSRYERALANIYRGIAVMVAAHLTPQRITMAVLNATDAECIRRAKAVVRCMRKYAGILRGA